MLIGNVIGCYKLLSPEKLPIFEWFSFSSKRMPLAEDARKFTSLGD